ncbi:hypothetical protein HS125_12895 [bacterium]|nr:hypothetical protein [bacterium]
MATPPAHQILLPKLTDRMTQGKVLRWLVREGAQVRRGDFVAEVQTDKAAMQVESPREGRIRRFLVPLGADVSVGAALVELEPPPMRRETGPAPPRALPNPTGDITDEDQMLVLDQEELTRVYEMTRAWREIPQAVVHCRINVEKAVAVVADYNRGFREPERKALRRADRPGGRRAPWRKSPSSTRALTDGASCGRRRSISIRGGCRRARDRGGTRRRGAHVRAGSVGKSAVAGGAGATRSTHRRTAQL